MNLIVKYVPYSFKSFLFENPLSLIFATLGLILLGLAFVKFIRLLRICKKLGIDYKDVKHDYVDDILRYIDLSDEKELKKLELANIIKIEKDELDYYKILQYLKKEVPEARLNMIIAALWTTLLMLPLITVTISAFHNNFNYEQQANLTEIKDHIKINNDKLTIETLPDTYEYKNEKLKKDELHDFKIIKDEFYRDTDIKLVDKTNNEYIISKSEFEELVRK